MVNQSTSINSSEQFTKTDSSFPSDHFTNSHQNYGKREVQNSEAAPCDCGCDEFYFESLDGAVIREILRESKGK